LTAKSLSCRRGNEWLFKGLDFKCEPEQLLWLRGSNGSGKTSLLRILAGLSLADEGELSFRTDDRAAFRKTLVYVGHTNGLKDDLTVLESLNFVAKLHGRPSGNEALGIALRRLAIHHRRHAYVRTLSQGQRRRVALSRLALEHEPCLWILDEPFDSLDAEGIDAINGLLKEHLDRGGGIVLTSHVPLSLADANIRQIELGMSRAL
jgi:heme exporter protein A